MVPTILLAITAFMPRLSAVRADEVRSTDDVVMRAMVDELDRSMRDLSLEGLPKPYFIQINAQDRLTYSMSAEYGAITKSDDTRNRMLNVRVRVGSYELDNTNFRRPFGQFGLLPQDDDYTALRCAIWLLIDRDYKQAVETLSSKQAFLKDKKAEDRPDDYSPAPVVTEVEPRAALAFDAKEWEKNLARLSDRFNQYPKIQDAQVTLFAGTADEWIVNSEGTRLRTGDSGIGIEVQAELQAPDGMPLSDSLSYLGERVDQLPPIEKMLADIDEMCRKLVALSEAPILDQYTGPVLFEPSASGRVFEALLGEGICARPQSVGGGEDPNSLEKKLGLRILPRSFQIYDDPGPRMFGDSVLAGAYEFDDEAVAPKRVNVVEKGVLKDLLSGRAPTRKIAQSNGHGRSGGVGDARAEVGCLYVSDENGMPGDELKRELTQAAQEEGLSFGLRIAALEGGSDNSLGNPIYAYKVACDGDKEELVRGLQFRSVQTRAMKRLLAAGTERKAHNSLGRVSSSFIVPAIVFEELELARIEREFDKLPILPPPALRGK
ncbi:MAG: metallopeptidase TldD-related protein [Planctomycetota bacterium]